MNKASFNGKNHTESEKNGKQAKKATKTMESDSSPSKQQKLYTENANDTVEQNEAKKFVYLVGDSLLNGNERSLTKNHNVKIKANGGATTRDMIDHVKPVLRRAPNTILSHRGTNDLTSNISTIEQMEEIMKIAKQESSSTKIVLSSVITRTDQAGIKKKVSKLNNKLRTVYNEMVSH